MYSLQRLSARALLTHGVTQRQDFPANRNLFIVECYLVGEVNRWRRKHEELLKMAARYNVTLGDFACCFHIMNSGTILDKLTAKTVLAEARFPLAVKLCFAALYCLDKFFQENTKTSIQNGIDLNIPILLDCFKLCTGAVDATEMQQWFTKACGYGFVRLAKRLWELFDHVVRPESGEVLNLFLEAAVQHDKLVMNFILERWNLNARLVADSYCRGLVTLYCGKPGLFYAVLEYVSRHTLAYVIASSFENVTWDCIQLAAKVGNMPFMNAWLVHSGTGALVGLAYWDHVCALARDPGQWPLFEALASCVLNANHIAWYELISSRDYALFMHACENNHVRLVRMMLQACHLGAPPWTRGEQITCLQLMLSRDDYAAFRSACRAGHDAVVRCIASHVPQSAWVLMLSAKNFVAGFNAAKSGSLSLLEVIRTKSSQKTWERFVASFYDGKDRRDLAQVYTTNVLHYLEMEKLRMQIVRVRISST